MSRILDQLDFWRFQGMLVQSYHVHSFGSPQAFAMLLH